MSDLVDTARALIREARRANHRRTLLLAGEHSWCLAAAREVLVAVNLEPVVWISDHAPEDAWSLSAAKADSILGSEVEAAVFDAHSGFHPDAFAAVSGTIRGGGVLLLLAPDLDKWPTFADPCHRLITVSPYESEDVPGRFLRRLVGVLRSDPDVGIVEQVPSAGNREPARAAEGLAQQPAALGRSAGRTGAESPCVTEDQRQAVDAIVRAGTGRRRRPVVLTSDRGRGKSAALGIAAARLLREGMDHIVVTAPRLAAVDRVFEHAGRVLVDARTSRAALHWGGKRVEFLPPDALVRETHPARLLLVDEAAAIPAPLLEQLLERYSRIVFATTVHGYEGTGRGFAVRFNQVLDRRTPQWSAVRLETPVRWASDDPLERLVFEALLLDAKAAPDEAVTGLAPDEVTTERLDRDSLLADSQTLSELFGLLVLAHYRTRPFDLRLLLDAPNVSVFVMRRHGHVVATALVAAEGRLSEEVSWRVWAGHERPHGHLLPESLAAHGGFERAPLLGCGRIMRIAVHPEVQRRGLGNRLLDHIACEEQAAGRDYIGSSFGATNDLLQFWCHSDFAPVRLSVTRGSASGTHSVIMLRGLSGDGKHLVADARQRFLEQFPFQLGDPLQDLEADMATLLFADDHSTTPALSTMDWRDLVAFAFGKRIYEVCIGPLWKLAGAGLADPAARAQLRRAERHVLVVKVLQKSDWSRAAEVSGAAGRGEGMEVLRGAVRTLVVHYADEGIREEARRLTAQRQ